ncbi:hypothetical protein SB724_19190 [Bacillus sp. SIMBA_031]|uniref:hypothetical protein n=1 Tax=Bacillus sp. SIMBA_031 TaxID=3085774 RepID=UPI00397B3F25
MSSLFRAKEDKNALYPETDDLLIVFDEDSKTSEIHRISDFREDRIIVTGVHSIPLQDCEVTNSVEGRHFFYRAPQKSIAETKRLAQMEKSMVLSQITHYKPREEQKNMDLNKIFLMIIVFVLILILGVSSCSAKKTASGVSAFNEQQQQIHDFNPRL